MFQIRGVWLVTRGEVEEGEGSARRRPAGARVQGPHGGITGFRVGVTVGPGEGGGVGKGVGKGVGGGLGSATQHPVFRAVGTRDGALVGPAVGPTVGETVGARVGSCEPRTLYTYFGEDSPRSLRPPTSTALQLVDGTPPRHVMLLPTQSDSGSKPLSLQLGRPDASAGQSAAKTGPNGGQPPRVGAYVSVVGA